MRFFTSLSLLTRHGAHILACWLALAAAAQAQSIAPFKVYTGSVGHYDITRGVNTIKVNDGFLATGTVPVNANGVYRIKPGQALALLYQARNLNAGKESADFGALPVQGFRKVIRKVDGQEVQMENYPGASTRFELTLINKGSDDEYSISRKFKSKFNPPLPSADFDRTHGIFLVNSTDANAALREPAFAKDVNKVAGKMLTIYYLVNPLDATPFLTIEVDFTGVAPAAENTRGAASAAKAGGNAAAPLRADGAATGRQPVDERTDAMTRKGDDKAAAREARAEARANAAEERARKRAEAAARRAGS